MATKREAGEASASSGPALGAGGVKRKRWETIGPKEATEVDLKHVKRGVWLVRLPKVLAEWIETREVGSVIGDMTIPPGDAVDRGAKTEFTLRDHFREVPYEYTLDMGKERKTYDKMFAVTDDDEHVSMEGHVNDEGIIMPKKTREYAQLMQAMMKRPKTVMTKLASESESKQAQAILPVTAAQRAKHDEQAIGRKLVNTEDKRTRMPEHEFIDLLFQCFEEKRFWTTRQLLDSTKQPEVFVKDILRKMCDYHARGEHHGTWELKQEHRNLKHKEDEVKDEVKTE